MMTQQIIEADLTWTGERFERGVHIGIEDGRIVFVGIEGRSHARRLVGKAIMPGFINAHSHAFQRGLRGRGETFPAAGTGTGSFWSWREEMYRLVEAADERSVYSLSRQAFEEMRQAGITAVGEFHYLHHDASCAGYAFDEVVLRAARDAGLRIVLLCVFYATGGLDHARHKPLTGGQLRFRTNSLDEYWRQMDRLAQMIDPATQSLGVVAHSIRAAPIEMIAELHQESERRHLPFHMHVEEQPREVEDCVHRYGKTPMALLNASLQIDPLFTAVHCTHTATVDMDDFLAAGGNVCICPLTEANLGDGLANVPGILRRGGNICLGTDSNARISMIEEMRWLEYGQRLGLQSRGVCVDEKGDVANQLFAMATTSGARSLALRAGAIRQGAAADFTVIDLSAPSLQGAEPETLLAAIIFGAGNEIVTGTCIAGEWRS